MKQESGPDRPPEDLFEAVVEAVVFASSDPVRPEEIAEAIGEGVESSEVEEALDSLLERHRSGPGGLHIEKVAGGYRLATRPEVGAWVRNFFRQRNRTRLSASALETLAIVAYRQPITGPEIQAIRGKDPSYGLKSLLEKRMIRILGRKKVVGNPILYGTSRHFLVHFGLDSLEDLPSIEDFDAFLGALEARQGDLFAPGAGEEPEEPPDPEAEEDGRDGP